MKLTSHYECTWLYLSFNNPEQAAASMGPRIHTCHTRRGLVIEKLSNVSEYFNKTKLRAIVLE